MQQGRAGIVRFQVHSLLCHRHRVTYRKLEDELDRQVERALTLIEPAIILALSGVVAFIITSLMSAIISVNDLAI